MRCSHLIACPWLATVLFWSVFGACIDAPPPASPPIARVVVSWDPRACRAPHRVVLELEDDDGAPLSSSVPCGLGGLTVDVPHFGVYRGRIYAWVAGEPIR